MGDNLETKNRLEGLKQILVDGANNLSTKNRHCDFTANSYDEVFENCYLGD
jgi:hypothetical protein